MLLVLERLLAVEVADNLLRRGRPGGGIGRVGVPRVSDVRKYTLVEGCT